MRRVASLRHEFVEFVPKDLKDGVVYVSLKYATAAHNCCCGCGTKVVTPLSPTDWALIFDGQSVSLDPSIGNWSYPCRSHYWIRHGRVRWANQWTKSMIDANRLRDSNQRAEYYRNVSEADASSATPRRRRTAFWQRLFRR